MSRILESRQASLERAAQHGDEPEPTKVVPFGLYGGGSFTGHPIGLVIVFGMFLMGLIAFPFAKWFFGAALVLGGFVALVLRALHR